MLLIVHKFFYGQVTVTTSKVANIHWEEARVLIIQITVRMNSASIVSSQVIAVPNFIAV